MSQKNFFLEKHHKIDNALALIMVCNKKKKDKYVKIKMILLKCR